MICPKCRVKIADRDKYCPRCGEILDHSDLEKLGNNLENKLLDIYFLIATNASIIDILTFVATSDFKIVLSIATPCSVNTLGFLYFPPLNSIFFWSKILTKRFLESQSFNFQLNLSGNLSTLFLKNDLPIFKR